MGAAKAMATHRVQAPAVQTSRPTIWSRQLRGQEREAMVKELRFAWQLLHDLKEGKAVNVEPEEYQRALNGIETAGKYFGGK